MMDKPNIKWIGSPNHSAASKQLKTLAIVNHIMQGTLAGTDAWFANPASQVSSHFGAGRIHESIFYHKTIAWNLKNSYSSHFCC